MAHTSNIAVEDSVKEFLTSQKLVPQESYNNVLLRIKEKLALKK